MTVKFPLCYYWGGGDTERGRETREGRKNYVTCKETVEDVAEF